MFEDYYMTPDDVAKPLKISKPFAYKVIRKMNAELQEQGFFTMAGKVNKQFFLDKTCYDAAKVNPERSNQNTAYCDENIRDVYHELFDEALKKYNAKQTRADRMVDDYYEKIRFGKQEKPFHEIIMQIGDWENTAVDSDTGRLAIEILDEYMKGFAERNPSLRVFSAHLHLDEVSMSTTKCRKTPIENVGYTSKLSS